MVVLVMLVVFDCFPVREYSVRVMRGLTVRVGVTVSVAASMRVSMSSTSVGVAVLTKHKNADKVDKQTQHRHH
jgi:hypothetical protein